ncbi:hypothetical protein E2562_018707 [Oryza meyeriana var. granulata]|uniref:Uncharacterized protein n=1 Tax=Oryza meyeriana var. granulata TaxID=110450 RepID=A0A6G1EMQ2_9ORYZ|nr:hypothetical protein E2562_018707 [Oryza meyeriana var. granulata]
MNCIKIAMLVTLIVPLALRGASLLGNIVVAAVVPSPEQQPPPGSKNGASWSAPGGQADHQHWSWQQHRKDQSRHTGFTRRRFGTAGGGDGFFDDDKRFSPTGSNPLHNL